MKELFKTFVVGLAIVLCILAIMVVFNGLVWLGVNYPYVGIPFGISVASIVVGWFVRSAL